MASRQFRRAVVRTLLPVACAAIAVLGCSPDGFVDGLPAADSPQVAPADRAPADDALGDGNRAASEWPKLVGRYSWLAATDAAEASRGAHAYFEALPYGMPGWDTVGNDRGGAAYAWLQLLERLADDPPSELLAFVVSYFVNGWGELAAVDERLALPDELFTTGVGDAEDFALLKYVTLRRLEVPASAMRVIRVRRADGSRHAVLAVRLEQTTILDRSAAQPLAYLEQRWPDDYSPELAYNEHGIWALAR